MLESDRYLNKKVMQFKGQL